MHYSGCPYSSISIPYAAFDSTYEDVAPKFMPTIAQPLCEAFGVEFLCQSLPVVAFSPLTDYIICENFEGIEPRMKFTKE